MSTNPQDAYLGIMTTIRRRLDVVRTLRASDADEFSKAETSAFHGRKIVEGISFACLVATEHGIKHVPRDARGQWNAESIIKSLSAKNLTTFPSPSVIRNATPCEHEETNVAAVIEGVPDKRITPEELTQIYQRLHRWLHEVNPYVESDHEEFCSKHADPLWEDLARLEAFIDKHFVSISGEGFFCVLRDTQDGLTKVQPLSKVASI
ncbi:MAG: hypothetical protein AAGG48_18160 [Planctomycetota bacterium]